MLSIRTHGPSSSCVHTSPDPVGARQHISPSRQSALKAVFAVKPHPSRDERSAIACEIDMDLKAVTIWFQNKRQAAKRKAARTDENTLPLKYKHHPLPLDCPFPFRSFRNMPLREIVSLDHIAQLTERPSNLPPASPRYQHVLTNNSILPTTPCSPELWQLMPSSPVACPSSPDKDQARFSVLPAQSKSLKSLEWACAKARVSDRDEESENSEYLQSFDLIWDGVETEDGEDEAVTPNTSFSLSPNIEAEASEATSDSIMDSKHAEPTKNVHAFRDVDAAMVLLDLLGRR